MPSSIYWRALSFDEVIVVDGSDPETVAAHRATFEPQVRVMEPAVRTPMGKVGNVLTGLRAATHEHVVIADDDVRYEPPELARTVALLDDADVVRPQNYFAPLPWHARIDTARTLLNRMSGGDWPGTLGVRRSLLLRAGGYAGDVMFENLELVRTVRAAGGRELVALDLLVRRLPCTTAHFRGQQIRQAYDELARPVRLVISLATLPAATYALASGRERAVLGAAGGLTLLAAAGWWRGGGRRVFPLSSVLFAAPWSVWRSACSWAAVWARLRGGVRYRDVRIARAATPAAELRRRLRASTVSIRIMVQSFNPFDPGQAHGAWALLEELRAAAPVASISGGMHYVTRHAECHGVLRDTATFSNASGFKAPGVEIPTEDRLLGELDPPRHTAVRRVMVTALTPKVVHAAEPFVRATAIALLAGVSERADLVPAFTVPLPNRVTLHMLGLDPADADQIARWAKELMESTFPLMNRTERGEGFAGAFPEFAGYIEAHIARRADALARGEEHDDVLARLLRLEVDGEPLPGRQVRALVRNLITGGLTTTSQLLGNLLFQLLSVPGLEDAIRADRTRLVSAIEESLRIAPPVLFVPRGCITETQVGGCSVHVGERVIVGTASANRDERVFDDAGEFRLDRAHLDQHLTFGYGAHVCPGATVARTVARIAIETFLDTFPAGEVRLERGYEFENVPTYFETGPRRLPVELVSGGRE